MAGYVEHLVLQHKAPKSFRVPKEQNLFRSRQSLQASLANCVGTRHPHTLNCREAISLSPSSHQDNTHFTGKNVFAVRFTLVILQFSQELEALAVCKLPGVYSTEGFTHWFPQPWLQQTAAIYTWWIGKLREKPVWCCTQSYVQSLYSTHKINFSYQPINGKRVWLCSVPFSLELRATRWLITKKSRKHNSLRWSLDFLEDDLCFTAEINIYSWEAAPGIYLRTAGAGYLFPQPLALLTMIWYFQTIKAWYCRKEEKKLDQLN